MRLVIIFYLYTLYAYEVNGTNYLLAISIPMLVVRSKKYEPNIISYINIIVPNKIVITDIQSRVYGF